MNSTPDAYSSPESMEKSPGKSLPLRIWPLILLLVLVPVCFIPEMLYPGELLVMMIRFLGPGLVGVLTLLWWLFFSRAKVAEKILVFLGVIIAVTATMWFIDPTMIGPPILVLVTPLGMGLFALAAIVFRKKPPIARGSAILLASILGFALSLLVRNDGLWGGQGVFDFQWRFGNRVDQQLVKDNSELNSKTSYTQPEMKQWLSAPQWPGFRGPNQDSVVTGIQIDSDWDSNPPKLLWEKDAGLGWSSFSVAGNLIFTQEQRGNKECVICYDAKTGNEIWIHSIENRFEDNLGGPGPRATPTIADGDVFNLGAYGQLCRIDALTGKQKWMVDIRKVADREPPIWGFCSSPLIIGDKVIVHAGGKGDKGVLAFNTEDGKLAWSAPSGDHSYSSSQKMEIEGQDYVAMSSNDGLDLVDPNSGERKFRYEWKEEGYRTPQPVKFLDRSIVLSGETGSRIVKLKKDEDGATFVVDEMTEAKKFRPDFNDFVILGDYAYGFSGANFRSVNLKTGKVSTQRERYGKGQVLLIKDSELLIVVTESGELALLEAEDGEFEEIGKVEALSGKTWNHPVIADGKLYVRNSSQIQCFQLATPK